MSKKYRFHLIAYENGRKIDECDYEDNELPALLLGKGVYQEIIDYLNERAGTHFRVCKKTKEKIDARLHDHYTLDEFKKVIDNKAELWLNDPEMSHNLRPLTLFGPKFDYYLNEIHAKPKPKKGDISGKPTYDLKKIAAAAEQNTEIKYR